ARRARAGSRCARGRDAVRAAMGVRGTEAGRLLSARRPAQRPERLHLAAELQVWLCGHRRGIVLGGLKSSKVAPLRARARRPNPRSAEPTNGCGPRDVCSRARLHSAPGTLGMESMPAVAFVDRSTNARGGTGVMSTEVLK